MPGGRTFRLIGLALVIAAALAATPSRAQVAALRQIPDGLDAKAQAPLAADRARLRILLQQMTKDGRLFNSQCANVRKNSPEAANCRKRFAVLDRKRLAYDAEAKAFNARLADAIAGDRRRLQAELTKLRGRIARHQQALRNLGFETTAKQFDDYAEMAAEGRAQATGVLASAAMTMALGRLEKYILKNRPTNENAAGAIRLRLRDIGVRDPFVLDAAAKLHILKPAGIKKFFKLLKASGKTAIAGAASADAKKTVATGIIEALALKIKDPDVIKAVGVGKLLVKSIIYAETYDVAYEGSERLMRASEGQIEGFKKVDALLKTDITALVAAKRDLKRLKAKP